MTNKEQGADAPSTNDWKEEIINDMHNIRALTEEEKARIREALTLAEKHFYESIVSVNRLNERLSQLAETNKQQIADLQAENNELKSEKKKTKSKLKWFLSKQVPNKDNWIIPVRISEFKEIFKRELTTSGSVPESELKKKIGDKP